jgi:hypothetical protein
MTDRYLGAAGIATAMGLSRHAVHKWRSRHPSDSRHPFPAPDVEVDGIPGWRPDRLEEIMQWRDGLPGRGTGGGRPSATLQEYFREAALQRLDREEAVRTLDAFGAEYPEWTREEVAAWLIGKWRS